MSMLRLFVFSMFMFCSFTAMSASDLEKKSKLTHLTIGYQQKALPFSYTSNKGDIPIGYSIDLCKRVIEIISATLGHTISIDFFPVVSNTRTPALLNGDIDLECGVTTNSVVRQKKVAFSNTIFIASQKIAVRAKERTKFINDLSAYRLVVIRGATGEALGRKLSDENPSIKIVTADSLGDAYKTFITGKADAVLADDVILASMFANETDPSEFQFLEGAFSVEPFGIMVRKGDTLKSLIDAALTEIYQSGYIYKLYDKWFLRKLPDRDVNLELPLSDEIRSIYDFPNDIGLDS